MKTKEKHKEMFAHIKAWEESGQRRDGFCKSRGLSLHSFGYWRTRYLREQGKSRSSFIRIAPDFQTPLEIHYANGTYLKVPAVSPMSLVKSLVGLQ